MNFIILIICCIGLPVISLRPTQPKLCINCKYFIPDIVTDTISDVSTFSKCSLFPTKRGKINYLVNGIITYDYFYCSTSREFNDMCGEEGKYYKKRETA
jgi:hypothetical protein